MTRRIAVTPMDASPVSDADLARVAAEEKLHAEHRSRTALVIAASARDADDCRLLFDILGLDTETVAAARSTAHRPKRRRKTAA